MAGRATEPVCPLCDEALPDGERLRVLAKHFETCAKTDRLAQGRE